MAIKAATMADRERWTWAADVGCVCCIMEEEMRREDYGTRQATPPDVHHEIDGYRTGHERTAFVCPWHHRGVVQINGETVQTMSNKAGPSLKHNPRLFRARYGSDSQLVWKTDYEIDRHRSRMVGA